MFITDNPAADTKYISEMIPSIHESTQKFNAFQEDDSDSDSYDGDNCVPYDRENVTIASTVGEMNDAADAVREIVTSSNSKWIGFDTETEVETNSATGRPMGVKKRVGLIQLCYRDGEQKEQVLLLRICKSAKIPDRVQALLEDKRITFVGNNIHGDITGLIRDYPEMKAVFERRGGKRNRMINLSVHARRRDVIQTSSAKLPLLTKRVLDLYMPKDDNDTFSRWNCNVLRDAQVKYAALDVIASLLLFEKLQIMTDLEQRLSKKDAQVNDKVDIAPNSGAGKGMMATRAATGIIVDIVNCRSPGEKIC